MIGLLMLTDEQVKWINHLSDIDKIKIIPYDQLSVEKFKIVKDKIKDHLGQDIQVEHRGATSLRISGQDEIDIYIPVPENRFDFYLLLLEKAFDKPRSHYPLARARFVTFVESKHIDIFLINKESSDWFNLLKFEKYLRDHPKALGDYEKLKELGNNISVREYYRRKVEFINLILEKNHA